MMNIPAPRRQAALAFIFVTVLIDMLAFGMIIPVLPILVQDFVGGNAARAAEMYGLFGTAWALMQLIFSPVQGSLSDHFGRRTVILVSCAGLGVDFILMALAPNLWWLLVGRVISGITAASFSTAGAYISDVTPAEKRAASFGLIGAAFGMDSFWDRRSAVSSAPSRRACRSGPRHSWLSPMFAGAYSCCPNRCRKKGAYLFPGRAPIRSGP